MRVIADRNNGVPYAILSTRVPVKMQIYARTLSFFSGKTLKTMYAEAATQFFSDKPWEHGLQWRPTHTASTKLGEQSGPTVSGWMQTYIHLPLVLGESLERLAHEQHVPLSHVLYTMFYWFTWWIHPPKSESQRRAALLHRREV